MIPNRARRHLLLLTTSAKSTDFPKARSRGRMHSLPLHLGKIPKLGSPVKRRSEAWFRGSSLGGGTRTTSERARGEGPSFSISRAVSRRGDPETEDPSVAAPDPARGGG